MTEGQLTNGSIETDRLPEGVLEYAVWEPPGYETGQTLPLIVNLHGGGGSRDNLESLLPAVEAATRAGDLPAAVWTSPSAGRSFYMDFKDGTADWESVIIEAYIPALMRQYGVSDANDVVLTGASMGGMGALRMAFKYPERFGAVAVLEPAIEAALKWDELTVTDTFYRKDQYGVIFGDPVDPDYWTANHPTAIADRLPRSLDSLDIYFEAGDVDDLRLYRGAEFLHRVLFDHGVKHEYRLVRGADHIGAEFMKQRFVNLLGFVNRHFNPVDEGLQGKMVKKAMSAFIDTTELEADVPLPSHR